MSTAMLLALVLVFLLVTDLRRVVLRGPKRLTWFYSVCYAVSFVILILYSLGVTLYGPSQLVMDIARALALIET